MAAEATVTAAAAAAAAAGVVVMVAIMMGEVRTFGLFLIFFFLPSSTTSGSNTRVKRSPVVAAGIGGEVGKRKRARGCTV